MTTGLAHLSLALVAFLVPLRLPGQQRAISLPPTEGFAVVQVLTTGTGDRESIHTVEKVIPGALLWSWRLVEVTGRDTLRQEFVYQERAEDIARAFQLRLVHAPADPPEHPGYTMHSISRSVYQHLRAAGSDTFQVMSVENAANPLLPGMLANPVPVRWRGTLVATGKAPVAFPVLVNGDRTSVPALVLRGHLEARGKKWEPEIWVLADSAYPLILRWLGGANETGNILQTVRIDIAAPTPEALAQELGADCRAELPGIYFGFNSAVIDAASSRTIAAVAATLKRHPGWAVTLEGHTDSIGGAAANKALSGRRVAAVKERLISGYGADRGRIEVVGFGSARPRESNATVQGRARNRRVELVRQCTGQ